MTQLGAWVTENFEAFVACLALISALYAGYATRQHNKLSVRPNLNLDLTYEKIDDKMVIEASLTNSGIGPAIISEITCYYEDESLLIRGTQISKITAKLDQIVQVSQIEAQALTGIPIEGYFIAANQKINLISIFIDFESYRKSRFTLDPLIGKFEFRIKYKSIYGDKFQFPENKSLSK